ncbi:MAG TPA: hypothetical protein VIT68_03635, partial [Candidatus Gracilibacteria bacterium]
MGEFGGNSPENLEVGETQQASSGAKATIETIEDTLENIYEKDQNAPAVGALEEAVPQDSDSAQDAAYQVEQALGNKNNSGDWLSELIKAFEDFLKTISGEKVSKNFGLPLVSAPPEEPPPEAIDPQAPIEEPSQEPQKEPKDREEPIPDPIDPIEPIEPIEEPASIELTPNQQAEDSARMAFSGRDVDWMLPLYGKDIKSVDLGWFEGRTDVAIGEFIQHPDHRALLIEALDQERQNTFEVQLSQFEFRKTLFDHYFFDYMEQQKASKEDLVQLYQALNSGDLTVLQSAESLVFLRAYNHLYPDLSISGFLQDFPGDWAKIRNEVKIVTVDKIQRITDRENEQRKAREAQERLEAERHRRELEEREAQERREAEQRREEAERRQRQESLRGHRQEYEQRRDSATQKARIDFPTHYFREQQDVFSRYKPQDYAYGPALEICYQSLSQDRDTRFDALEEEAFLEQAFESAQENLAEMKRFFARAQEDPESDTLMRKEEAILKELEPKILRKQRLISEAKERQGAFMRSRIGETMSAAEYEEYCAGAALDQEGVGTCYYVAAYNIIDELPLYPWMLRTHCDISGRKGDETFTFYFPLTAPRHQCNTYTVKRSEIKDKVEVEKESIDAYGNTRTSASSARANKSDTLIPRAMEIAYMKAFRTGFVKPDGSLNWSKAESGSMGAVQQNLLGSEYVKAERIWTQNSSTEEAKDFFSYIYNPQRFVVNVSLHKEKEDADIDIKDINGRSVHIYDHHAYSVRRVDQKQKTITFNNPHVGDGQPITLSIESFVEEFRNIEISE